MIWKTVLRWLTLVAMVGLSLGVMVPAASADTEITSCPFTITTAGNFFLKTNLSATGDCIIVNHNDVGIDMKGHTITGNGTGSAISSGIFVESVAVTNGKIKNFDDGIDFDGELITLEKVDSSDNKGIGIFISDCCNSLTDIKANGNVEEGVFIDDCCSVYNKIQANDDGFDGLLAGCCDTANQITANGNGGNGIDLEDCCTGISNSQANDNKSNGIEVTSSVNSVANVKTNGNKNAGIELTGEESQVTNATANGNGGDGIDFGSFDESVADSTANNNGNIGIDLANSDFNTVTDATTNHNKTGVAIDCPGNVVNVRSHNNTTNLSTIGGTCTELNNNIGP